MKIIYEMPTLVRKILRTQKIQDGTTLRKSHFWVETDVAEGTLLYHTMTKEFLLLEPGEADTAETQKYLADHWFLVPADTDERKLSNQLKEIALILSQRKKKNTLKDISILTTTDCNARCFYCYQHGCDKLTMDDETAAKVAAYILDKGDPNNIHLAWYGGEPLFNLAAIDRICCILKTEKQSFYSTMISNGYLFDDELVQKAVADWKLQRIQISLDGTESIYNKRKAYIYREEQSAFQRVLSNIDRLLDAGVNVSIRLNVDSGNVEDLRTLCHYLAERFGSCSNLSVYAYPLYQDLQQKRPSTSTDALSKLLNDYTALVEEIRQLGILNVPSLRKDLQLNRCMADNDRSIVILPDGTLHTCDHFNECESIGHIDSEELNQSVLQSWKKLRPEQQECENCPLYPNCMRLLNCPHDSLICYPAIRDNNLNRLKWAMESAWEKFNSEGNIPDEESEDI